MGFPDPRADGWRLVLAQVSFFCARDRVVYLASFKGIESNVPGCDRHHFAGYRIIHEAVEYPCFSSHSYRVNLLDRRGRMPHAYGKPLQQRKAPEFGLDSQ